MALALCLCGETASLRADAPVAGYVFPAGGQRGKTVSIRVGGLNLYDRCDWELVGKGVHAGTHLLRTPTLWFEGPRLPLPDSQRQEDYYADMAGEVRIDADAAPGPRRGRLWTAGGVASGLVFVVGELPEVVETEIDGDPIAVEVKAPVTINGRIFPREDLDVWSFAAKKGQPVTCEVDAARIGSPLDSRLEVFGPEGKLVVENDDNGDPDSLVSFVAPSDGTYRVRISDANRAGSQRHVYRLTITTTPHVRHVYPLGGRRGEKVRFVLGGAGLDGETVELALPGVVGLHDLRFACKGGASQPVALDVDEPSEAIEREPNDGDATAGKLDFPGVANGRIDRPGDVDSWRFAAKKGDAMLVELRAALLGSPLRGALEITDADGKSLRTAEYAGADPSILFAVSKDGEYLVRVRDRFRSRGGPAFAYRLRLAKPTPEFELRLVSDALTAVRGQPAKLRVNVATQGGFAEPIALTFEGLPSGVKVSPEKIGPRQQAVDLVFTAGPEARVGPATVRLVATAKGVVRTAELVLGVAVKVPFKVVGAYDLRIAPRGTVFRKRFKIERNGYDGPLEVRLADRQARHLQGVTGPVLKIAPGSDEFEYPVTLPPWMETGRTSRACVMAIGKVRDGDVEHTVSYTSQAQNDQLIAVVETGRLALEIGRTSLAARSGETASLPVSVRRGKGLTGPVKVELLIPAHVAGVTAPAVTLAAEQTTGVLKVRFDRRMGPFTAPLTVRASVATSEGAVTAEVKIEVVPGELPQ